MAHSLLPKPVAGADDNHASDATEFKEELDEDHVRCVVSFPVDQYWRPVGAIGDLLHLGLSLFWFRSRPLIVFWMM